MARSLAAGDYRLVVAVESSSAPDRWYRVLADRESGALSCDCPRWLYKRRGQRRSCRHTEAVGEIARGQLPGRRLSPPSEAAHLASLLEATRDQWRGLEGLWRVEERDISMGRDRYRLVRIELRTVGGLYGRGVVAFASRHSVATARLIPGLAGWGGYALAAQVAQAAGYEMVGAPPEHYRLPRRGRRADIGLRDILRVGDQVDLGDGLQPVERAEATLRLFLGPLYEQLERQGFLDVSSVRHAAQKRVYRLRRDPKRRVRRIRLFERGKYINDLCVVPAAHVPEADHFLTVFLQLISDEETVLEVVRRHNIFGPNSDGQEKETEPAIWRPRPEQPLAQAG